MVKNRKSRDAPRQCGPSKIHKVMSEFKAGTLHSGNGAVVRSRRQALAIALNESRRKCAGESKKRKRRAR